MSDVMEKEAISTVPDTAYTRRARYYDSGNAFNIVYPPVPASVFVDEARQALDPATETGLIDLDQSAAMGIDFPATTPLVLARYARIRAGEKLEVDVAATTELYYVIAGSGHTLKGADRIDWAKGDILSLPGDGVTIHEAGATDCVLWMVTNEPLLALEHLAPPKGDAARVEIAHFPAAEIDRQLEIAEKKLAGQVVAGLAVVFATEGLEAIRNVSPSLTLAMNQLPAGGNQVAHKHNSVAVSLPVQSEGGYSLVDGERKDWSPYATTVTPPNAVHAHRSEGTLPVRWLIVQDGGFYYHCRTMGFEFTAEQP